MSRSYTAVALASLCGVVCAQVMGLVWPELEPGSYSAIDMILLAPFAVACGGAGGGRYPLDVVFYVGGVLFFPIWGVAVWRWRVTGNWRWALLVVLACCQGFFRLQTRIAVLMGV